MSIEKVGKTIKSIRESKGISQKDLSKRTGLSRGHISGIENNKRVNNPTYNTLENIAFSLGVSVRSFFE